MSFNAVYLSAKSPAFKSSIFAARAGSSTKSITIEPAESVDVKFIDDYVPANYIAWKHHITGDRNIDNDPTLLIFTSTEKPTNNGHLKLVKENWF